MGKFEVLECKLNQLVHTYRTLKEENIILTEKVDSQGSEIVELNQIITQLKKEKESVKEKINDLANKIEIFEMDS